MKTLLLNLVLLISFILISACNHNPISPNGQLADPDLSEIAMIRADPFWGAVVIYNPDTCTKIGEACGFFRLQAYAHRHLNHTLLAKPSMYPASQVAQADCWSAKYGDSSEITAAAKLMLNNEENSDLKLHGNLAERAENIRSCAIEAGKWQG